MTKYQVQVHQTSTIKQNLQNILARLQMALSLVFKRGGDTMTNLVMLMAINIIEGRYTYERVPVKLKKRVLAQLQLSGLTVNENGELVEYKR